MPDHCNPTLLFFPHKLYFYNIARSVALHGVARSGQNPQQTFRLELDVDQVEVTHMQSPNRYREFISGLLDGGEASFEMNFVPGSTSDDRIFELLNLPTGVSRRRACRISFPNGVTWSFDAEVTGYEPDVPFDDAMTATVTLKVSGGITAGAT